MKQRRGTNLIINYKNLEIKNYKKLLIKKNRKKEQRPGQASPTGLFCKDSHVWALVFFLFLTGTDNMSSALNSFENKLDVVSFYLLRFRPLWWLENQGFNFFTQKFIFNIFLTQNTVRIVINLSMA